MDVTHGASTLAGRNQRVLFQIFFSEANATNFSFHVFCICFKDFLKLLMLQQSFLFFPEFLFEFVRFV